jgi:four helix bundle protein
VAAAKTFEDLIVWQKAHAAVLKVYAMTAKFPREEMFGLTSQLRRAMASVPANIAEGFGRRGIGDKTLLSFCLLPTAYFFRG